MNSAESLLVQELRSGRYTQVSDKLRARIRDENGNSTGRTGYCCLGVACLVLGTGQYNEITGDYKDGGLPSDLFLSTNVRNKLGWSSDRGVLNFKDKNGHKITLDQLNDSGFSFAQIADVIAADLVETRKDDATDDDI